MNKTLKRTLSISVRVFTYLLIAFTVFMMLFTVITVTTVDENERTVFGVRFYIVRTDSMSKSDKNADLDVHFNAGDIVVAKTVKDKKAFKEGDIITFISMNDDEVTKFKALTHMIREVKKNSKGEVIGYVTFGTNTGVNDDALVEPEDVLGIYAGKLPTVGKFFAFVKSTPGYITCILVPFLLLILYNGVNVIVLFKKYKNEQKELLDAERAEIAEERRKTEEMLRELQALKEQLEQKSSDSEQ